MRNKTEIEKAIITLLCNAYDEGMHSTGYHSLDDAPRNKWVKKQMLNIEKWYAKYSVATGTKITKEWFIDHNFKQLEVIGDWYSYQGGGKNFSFIVEKINDKWYVEIGDGFTDNPACGLEYTEEIEDIFFLLTGNNVVSKRFLENRCT